MTNNVTYHRNPFFTLGIEKAATLQVDRLKAEYEMAQAEVMHSPSVDGMAYVYGLHEALTMATASH